MPSFKAEIASILFQLRGSPWAILPTVQGVIQEYEHFNRTVRIKDSQRRVALQIFHASRAIDTLLAAMVNYERAKRHDPPRPSPLGASILFVQRHGIGGQMFNLPTAQDLTDLKNQRNVFLHTANLFPTDAEISLFMSRTIRGISEAATFPM